MSVEHHSADVCSCREQESKQDTANSVQMKESTKKSRFGMPEPAFFMRV